MTTHYASAEQVLVAYLSTVPGVGGCSVEMPANPAYPFILVTKVPGTGTDNGITQSAMVDIEVFHPNRAAAEAFTRPVHHFMLHLRHTHIGGVLIDNVRPNGAGFGWLDYQDADVNRYLAIYTIDSRITAQPL
ncbi:hypothetical protein ACKAMS_24860 [Rhodococcus sp. 5A-K4]|uniref:hypothetical protein n=1 Tax=Rhodococcus sp. 5A-K4 TaxID=3384442 RepID=UPI0038D4753E